jgi:hypothetical protein
MKGPEGTRLRVFFMALQDLQALHERLLNFLSPFLSPMSAAVRRRGEKKNPRREKKSLREKFSPRIIRAI